MAEEARAKRSLDDCVAEMDKMQTYAVKAIQAGNDADAKKFLEQKASLSTKLNGLQEAYNLANQNATKMRSKHDKLKRKSTRLNSSHIQKTRKPSSD